MTLHLHYSAGETVTWSKFINSYAPGSIALDGYVPTGPAYDSDGPFANFNHHEGVPRLETRSTCAQVLMAIKMGLLSDKRWRYVYVNDCDEDVCLSWWLLKHHYMIDGQNPAVSRLVHVVDMLDATGGAYPLSLDMPFLGQLAWVFAPYRNARRSRSLSIDVIDDVEMRIMRHIAGSGGSIKPDADYTITRKHQGYNGEATWVMMHEIGPYARTAMNADGIQAFVSHKFLSNSNFQPSWGYVIGRMSPFINFPVGRMLRALQRAEEAARKVTDSKRMGSWGGGDHIGGSPRPDGSMLPPDTVEGIVLQTLKDHNAGIEEYEEQSITVTVKHEKKRSGKS